VSDQDYFINEKTRGETGFFVGDVCLLVGVLALSRLNVVVLGGSGWCRWQERTERRPQYGLDGPWGAV